MLKPFEFMQRLMLVVVTTILLAGCGKDASLPEVATETSQQETGKESALDHAEKHLDPKYVCPMHPQIIKDEPGNCPICGMSLVLKQIDPNDGAKPTVEVSSAIQQSMGIRTAVAKRATIWKYIRTVGRIDYDETRLTHIHPRSDGWLEKLYFKSEGDPVRRGEKLGEIYSQEILSAQVDYLIAIKQANKTREEKARNRLRLLGVTEDTISRIQERKESQNTVPFFSPASGVVTRLVAREGMYVEPQMEIFTIADLTRIWVWVDVFEYQIDWLKTGLSAEIEVPAYPGRTWEGHLDYIYPELDPKSRTLRVRLAFNNPELLLKANMFAEVSIYGGPKENALVIPSESLIVTGERTSVVLAIGEGKFKPVDVVTGIERQGEVEILSGINEGDEVVTSGQFLIDSESSLRASFQRLSEED